MKNTKFGVILIKFSSYTFFNKNTAAAGIFSFEYVVSSSKQNYINKAKNSKHKKGPCFPLPLLVFHEKNLLFKLSFAALIRIEKVFFFHFLENMKNME